LVVVVACAAIRDGENEVRRAQVANVCVRLLLPPQTGWMVKHNTRACFAACGTTTDTMRGVLLAHTNLIDRCCYLCLQNKHFFVFELCEHNLAFAKRHWS
jgi:hypothetical protein